MGGTFAQQLTEGIQRGRMQNRPMPPGQQGPPNPFSMIPEMDFDPEKGLSVTLTPDHLQQLISGMGLMKQPGQQGMPPQMMGMNQGQQGPNSTPYTPPWLPQQQNMDIPYRIA